MYIVDMKVNDEWNVLFPNCGDKKHLQQRIENWRIYRPLSEIRVTDNKTYEILYEGKTKDAPTKF